MDDSEIQEAFNAGLAYRLEIPSEEVTVFPGWHWWQTAYPERAKASGGIAELLAADQHVAALYAALNSMDRSAAELLAKSVPLRTLVYQHGETLRRFSTALALRRDHAEVPGGQRAEPVWESLTGSSPAHPVAFFNALLTRDEGRLMAFFYTLSQVDRAHQRFFTLTAARTRRFYELFLQSPDAGKHQGFASYSGSFADFLREVPLNPDGSVNFPGGPEIWLVAKGHNSASQNVAKLSRKARRARASAADEDDILGRLVTTGYSAGSRRSSELANFVAVTRLDNERGQPLSAEEALLLAQSYSEFGSLFPYFAELGDLTASDYRQLFDLAASIRQFNPAKANIRFGQLHSFLELLCLAHQSGAVPDESLPRVLRAGLERYQKAGALEWASASLANLIDVESLFPERVASHDTAIRQLILGDCANGLSSCDTAREKSYRQLLDLQKVPALDLLFRLQESLQEIVKAHGTDVQIAQDLSTLAVVPLPKHAVVGSEVSRALEIYQTKRALSAAAKLHHAVSAKKRKDAEVNKFCGELLDELEPWVQLAMTGQVYARFLEPSDLAVSEDPLLLRKHEFAAFGATSKYGWLAEAAFEAQSEKQGSFFSGGLALFSLAAGQERSIGNHLGGNNGQIFSAAILASVRDTDWRPLTPQALAGFGATVRLARECIVESARSDEIWNALDEEATGVLSLARRKALLEGVHRHDWESVWHAVSISDLYYLGAALVESGPKELWRNAALSAMRQSAQQAGDLHFLGQVAPDLNGAGLPRLAEYLPYEEYQRSYPSSLAQRTAELKLYLAYRADADAWPLQHLADVAPMAADAAAKRIEAHDLWDWPAVLAAYRSLDTDILKEPLER